MPDQEEPPATFLNLTRTTYPKLVAQVMGEEPLTEEMVLRVLKKWREARERAGR